NDVNYDIIIDIHRDSLKADKTTITHEGESFAQAVFVIGEDHANFKFNQELAEKLIFEMEQIVPNITKNIVFKSGYGVEDKYNKNIHERVIIVESGGMRD